MQVFRWVTLCAAWVVTMGAAAQDLPNCARPQGWADSTVCANAELMEMHQRMQRLYEERRRMLDGEPHMDAVSYQRGWLRGREECESSFDDAARVACLKDLYRARMLQLGATSASTASPSISPSPQSPTSPSLSQTKPEPLPKADPAPLAEPTLAACRGDEPSWAMDIAARSVRMRLGAQSAVRALSGRLVISTALKASVWRGTEEGVPGQGEIVVMLTEESCALPSIRARFALMARVSLPDGNLIAGCCQRTPFATGIETPKVAAPAAVEHAGAVAGSQGIAVDKLLAVGTRIRLRDVDGSIVALRKSARISSGNVLTRARAGSTGQVEQATVREGTSWYFVALSGGDIKGWVMGELVEALNAVRPVALRSTEPDAPSDKPAVPPAARSVADMAVTLAAVRSPWWRNVAEHLPTIDACIDKARVRNVRVVKIETTTKGGRQIFMRDLVKSRIACEVSPDGTIKAKALDVDDAFPYDSGALFTRAPGTPPTSSCYRNDRVLDAGTRKVVGWNSFLKPGRRCK